MPHYLASHLHAAAFGRDLVLLDIVKGEYQLMAGVADVLFFTGRERVLNPMASHLSADLLEAGVVVARPTDGAPPPPKRPLRSALESPDRPLRLSDAGQMALAYGAMARRYWGRDLPFLLESARRSAAAMVAAPLPADAVATAARVFDKLSPWTPFQGDCLFRCFMLLQWLHRKRAPGVRWVFGVRTGPFHAHCWLQVGDLVLTDFADPLVNFVPIYAV